MVVCGVFFGLQKVGEKSPLIANVNFTIMMTCSDFQNHSLNSNLFHTLLHIPDLIKNLGWVKATNLNSAFSE